MKKLLIPILLLISALFFTGCIKEENRDDIVVGTFMGDKITDLEEDGFIIKTFNISNIDNSVVNFWVTYDFLYEDMNLNILKQQLERGTTIFIDKYNITAPEVYKLFNVPDEAIAINSDNFDDIESDLQRYGIIMFKHENLYYAVGYNSINYSKEGILSTFMMNKNTFIRIVK